MAPSDHDDRTAVDPFENRLARIVADLDEVDFEQFVPPEGMWMRIEAAVAADASTDASTGVGDVVEYRIDGSDVVSAGGDGWSQFARDNDATELVDLDGHRTLWSYFDGDEVCELWQLLVAQVRATQTEVRVPLRCDAPDMRRWFDLTITPEAHNAVRFRSALVFEEHREEVALLGIGTPRSDRALAVALCSWCGLGHDGSRWVELDELARTLRLMEGDEAPPVSHGICPSCREQMSADVLIAAGVVVSQSRRAED